MDGLYRNCSGVVLFNKHGMVFVGKRIDTEGFAWQLPQGGVNEEEDFKIAALRELKEETGITSVDVIYESRYIHKYDIPFHKSLWDGKYVGQIQKWFLAAFYGQDNEININTKEPEFNDWRWIDIHELQNFAIHFKKDVYKNISLEFAPIIERYLHT
ncbi:RNA pyrophosphohydrolase [Candidatus Cyrtobacter comes]|uniref:RNA pyrophosphohydrolase n=1 Tax=Candidatus Cyrtobacter comes TaxID=675776 RepID=A0ABU5L8Y1_9RICK|nr:RNA pyrophosphohydrolase [Candidatus Cyrtobacter comes]MDZ5762309.1 RNA pyrophosphohydrolase [Candidatus Cyrtobacter comes]